MWKRIAASEMCLVAQKLTGLFMYSACTQLLLSVPSPCLCLEILYWPGRDTSGVAGHAHPSG